MQRSPRKVTIKNVWIMSKTMCDIHVQLKVVMQYSTRYKDVDTHSNVQFPCPVEGCDAVFIQRASVKKHVDIVHNNVRYQCPIEGCDAISPTNVMWNNT